MIFSALFVKTQTWDAMFYKPADARFLARPP